MILKCWDEGTRCLPFRKGAFGAAHVGKLVFVRMRERKTFPLGGRWHGEAVTDEGKRRDFLGDNDKRGKLPTWYSCFPRRNPSVRQPLIRPSVRTGAPSPRGGRSCSASRQIPIYQTADKTIKKARPPPGRRPVLCSGYRLAPLAAMTWAYQAAESLGIRVPSR